MFFVINKEKIYSYIVAVCTVVILFVASETYIKEDAIEASTNVSNESNIENNMGNNMMNQTK